MPPKPSKQAMADFDYQLPSELIAQEPLANRSGSRLLVLNRAGRDISHRAFADLPDLLIPGDLLVMNDSRVLPARLLGNRESGGEVEFLLLREESPRRWLCLMRPARKLRIGEAVMFQSRRGTARMEATATVMAKQDDGQGVVELDEILAGHLGIFGRVPLPPYIHHQLDDDERYQTIYANEPGSAAAPTAGLHFSTKVLAELSERGISTTRVTLHVGLDTFRPVSSEFAEDHVIHSEWCSVSAEAAAAIAEARARKARVIAVGTTAARTLETFGQRSGPDRGQAFAGMTDIFIKPGYAWTVVNAMVTNFHLPKSTLMLMMSSFAGRTLLLAAYHEAIERRYRFFSFGDAMLIT